MQLWSNTVILLFLILILIFSTVNVRQSTNSFFIKYAPVNIFMYHTDKFFK